MILDRVEKQRTGLVQFLIVLIMAFLALIMVVTWKTDAHHLVKGMTILALLACLNVMVKERGLKRQHDRLLDEVVQKRDEVSSLGRELEAEKDQSSKLEQRLQELTSLYRAISSVNAVADHRQTYDAVLLAAVELVGGDCGSLMMVDNRGETLNFASAVGLKEEVLAKGGQGVDKGIAGWVASNREPVLLKGPAREDPRFAGRELREPELDIAISIPLQLGEKVIGVLNLGSTSKGSKLQFLEEDLRFAYLFAQHAAIAIERARAMERLAALTG